MCISTNAVASLDQAASRAAIMSASHGLNFMTAQMNPSPTRMTLGPQALPGVVDVRHSATQSCRNCIVPPAQSFNSSSQLSLNYLALRAIWQNGTQPHTQKFQSLSASRDCILNSKPLNPHTFHDGVQVIMGLLRNPA